MTGMRFDGRTAIVTGAGSGIGRATALRLVREGASVIGCDLNAEGLAAAQDELGDLAPAVRMLTGDITDQGFIDEVVAAHGRLDVLVNNAGGAPPAETATASPRFTERVVALNLLSAMYCAQRANHHMQSSVEGGAIVNVASVAGLRPAPTVAAYGAAKAGLLSFTATVGQEWLPRVRVNAVTCGMVRTEQAELHYGDAAGIARVEATIPAGRLALPADIGDICVWLASPLASYVSGANVVAHGGGDRPPFLDAAAG